MKAIIVLLTPILTAVAMANPIVDSAKAYGKAVNEVTNAQTKAASEVVKAEVQTKTDEKKENVNIKKKKVLKKIEEVQATTKNMALEAAKKVENSTEQLKKETN